MKLLLSVLLLFTIIVAGLASEMFASSPTEFVGEKVIVSSKEVGKHFENVSSAIARDTKSMEPLIKGGDIIYVQEIGDQAVIMRNRIYCFDADWAFNSVCHRAIGCYPVGECYNKVIFQGDNLHTVELINRSDIKEIVVGINFR